MAHETSLVKETWKLCWKRDPEMADRFFARLSWKYPSARRAIQSVFGKDTRLTERLAFLGHTIVEHLDDAEWLDQTVAMLVDGRAEHEVSLDVVAWIREALFDSLEEALGDDWTDETRAAWVDAWTSVVQRVLPLPRAAVA